MNDTASVQAATPGEPGEPVELEPGLRRILAPNPSPMTHWGTNTHILGTGRDLCVVDPGPDDPAHLAAILRATRGARIGTIVVTHSHRDHSSLAARLARESGAEVAAFGTSEAGRSAVMKALATAGPAFGGEGVHTGFRPDLILKDGARLASADWAVEAIHTPGHMGNHLCLAVGDVILTGDHVMGWASSLVSPPDGDVSDFIASCARLAERQARRLFPGHGAPVTDPAERLSWLIDHRQAREAQVLGMLERNSPATAASLARSIYADIPQAMLPAAERAVLAHLVDLWARGRIATPGPPTPQSVFTLP